MVEHTTFPTQGGTVELYTGFSTHGVRLVSGDGSLFVDADRVKVEPWRTDDALSTVRLWKENSLVSAIEMTNYLARRFAVECSRDGIETEGL